MSRPITSSGVYGFTLTSRSNVDLPYVYLQYGIPGLPLNNGVPYLGFSTGLQGSPGVAGVPWASLVPDANSNGQDLASGYAVDFADRQVDVMAEWSAEEVALTICDDGPGFAPEILGRIGEPYLTSRRRAASIDREAGGLGLGLFIAKTLLERSRATLSFANQLAPEHGARVRIRWTRADFEQSLSEPAGGEMELAGD